MKVRLQKILAQAGIASRRAAETLVSAGRVRVNGVIVSELGARAHPFEDKIEVDGRKILMERPIYAVLHKPRGVVSTVNDPEGRPTVLDQVKGLGRVYPVGRLDFATSGVLLLTNDGDFANGLMHPTRAVPKTYVVKVRGDMTDADIDRWAEGVDLEDGRTKPAQVRFIRHEGDKSWFEITITEGRNHQIRRMGDATGFFVMRLARVAFAGIGHVGLRPGDWRHLTRDELTELKEAYGVPKRVPRGTGGPVESAGRRTERTERRAPPAPKRGTKASMKRGGRAGSRTRDAAGPTEDRDLAATPPSKARSGVPARNRPGAGKPGGDRGNRRR